MNQLRSIFSALGILIICLSSVFAQSADSQPQIETNYEVILQVILGTSETAQKSDLPQNLSGIAGQLKNTFPFSNYRLVNTYLGRVANTGNFEYKSVSNIVGQESEQDSPSFLDWRLGRLRTAANAGRRTSFYVDGFKFGARVPIRFTNFKDESGKSPQVINYESVGLNLDKLNLTESTPALVGTLTLPKTTGTMFLVLTVKPVKD